MVMGSSTGGFGPAVHIPVGPIPVQVEKADFDRDGDVDLAILSIGEDAMRGWEYARSLHVLPGSGQGSFDSPFVIALAGATDPESRFAVGDFNGDEWPDLALLEPSWSRIRLSLNTGSGGPPDFREVAGQVDSPGGSRCLSAGDLTGDGNDDLVVGSTSPDGGRVDVLASDGGGGAASVAAREVDWSPTCLAVAQVDGDGMLDVAAGGAGIMGPARSCVLLGDGSGGLGAPVEAALLGDPSEVAAGDLDGNGLADLVLTAPRSQLLSSVLARDPADGPLFVRGDGNADMAVDLSDAVAILLILFRGRTATCLEACDVNDDFAVNVADPVFLLEFFFRNGPAPPAPYPAVGSDPGAESLPCGSTP